MRRELVFELISKEREYQDNTWGPTFDDKNTPNDWIAYIMHYAGRAVTLPWNEIKFREGVLKVATLCVAILERVEYAPRHYDK
jgi:hypothetical protein